MANQPVLCDWHSYRILQLKEFIKRINFSFFDVAYQSGGGGAEKTEQLQQPSAPRGDDSPGKQVHRQEPGKYNFPPLIAN